VNPRAVRATVVRLDLDQNVVTGSFGVLNKNVPVAILIEHPSVNQFEFVLRKATSAILFHEFVIWIGGLGILVQHPEVRMRWCSVEVLVIFLNIFPVVSFNIAESEKPLLQNGIAPVPQRQCETQRLRFVRNSC